MINPKVSIIIPVYNSQKTIKMCIKSALDQSYKNIEIVVIDDGSKDESLSICELLSEEDKRVVVYHKENGGVSTARNLGLSKATGEYIAFLDSDDILHPKAIEVLIGVANKENADAVLGNYIEFSDFNSVHFHTISDIVVSKSISQYEAWKHLFDEQHMVYGGVCGGVYKSQIFDPITFPVGRTYEDTSVAHLLYKDDCKIIYVDEVLYYYYMNNNSITHSISVKNVMDSILASEERTVWFKNKLGRSSDLHFDSMRVHLQHTMSCYRRFTDRDVKKRILRSFDKIILYSEVLKRDKSFFKECVYFRISHNLRNN